MVTTAARTKLSKRCSISCTSLVFSIATAAWAASARMSATSVWPNGRTWASAASVERIRRVPVELAVDELQHPDHLAGPGGDGRREHRAGVVSDGEVEARVEPVRHVGGQLPHVLHAHRLAGGGDVPRERGRVQGHSGGDHARRHRVVLGEHEAQQAVAVPVLDEVERAGVRADQLAPGGQDQLKEALQIALRGERNPDPHQIDLALVGDGRLAPLVNQPLAQGQHLERRLDGAVQVGVGATRRQPQERPSRRR